MLDTIHCDGRGIWSGFRAGTVHPWGTYRFDTSGAWPNMCYSPVAVFGSKAVIAFSEDLHQVQLTWVTTPAGDVQVVVEFSPCIARGSAELRIEVLDADVEAALKHYRGAYLAPLMARLRIPEATYRAQAPWAFGGWPSTRGQSVGAKGYVQWPPSDGKFGIYYRPFCPDWPVQYNIGVLINPYVMGSYPALDVPKPLPLRDATGKIDQQIADMKARGISFAYWDDGTAPEPDRPMYWQWTLNRYKLNGITVAPESSCDVAAWITGAIMHFPYTWGDFRAAKVATPNATQFCVFPHDVPGFDLARDVPWYVDAASKGVVPVLTVEQLHAYSMVQR